MTDALLSRSGVFSPWRDPRSGIVSHLLAGDAKHPNRAAPHQQTFYYTNPSLSGDLSRYWFYCIHPPAGGAISGRSLGFVDFDSGRLHHFPWTAFTGSSPMVDPLSDAVYWTNFSGIWQGSADPGVRPRLINRFTPSQVRNRTVHRYATHLTLTADRKAFFIDGHIGEDFVLGAAPLDGSDIELWQTLAENHNHGLANPRDPDLFLVARDYHTNPQTGIMTPYENRLWLVRRGGQVFPVYPTAEQAGPARTIITHNTHFAAELSRRVVTDPRAMHGHEWWSDDGRHIYYVHYQTGIERVSVSEAGTPGARPELVWPHDTVSHANTSPDGSLLVLDAMPSDAPDSHHVRFVNLRTQRAVDIVSRLPALSDPELRRYHVHPHPQFCGDGRYICYTTTVHDRVDAAFVSVAELLSATS